MRERTVRRNARTWVIGIALGVLILAAGVAVWLESRTDARTLTTNQGVVQETVELTSERGVTLRVEVVDSPIERSTGLMFRQTLADDTGMLFVFPEDTQTSFWMANTYLPLDIAFLDRDGTILEIHQRPDTRSTAQTVPVTPYRYALEMSLGWFARHDIAVGQRIHIPQ